ncbi:MAG: alpha/beta hydrolase-fold protein [Atopobiaceae bacterium]|nr:alpha/beta hydrolase-fold protein [Atopobiaceae bacterium]
MYHKEHSDSLDRDMEYKVFGEHGRICLAFPPQNGRFWDFEDFGMVDTVMPWIEAGLLQVVCVDSIDTESWSGTGDEHDRIFQHERWFKYVCEELLPKLHERNGDVELAMTCGCSMGAMHAANFLFRRPDLFDATIALSGVYNADYFFPDYSDTLVYFNSPIDYLSGMPEGHEYMDMYRQSDIICCVGQGDWEEDLLASTRRLDAILQDKGIPAWVDYWGADVSHDWPWWRKQLPYFMGHLLGSPSDPR